jgi:hypothetical protein
MLGEELYNNNLGPKDYEEDKDCFKTIGLSQESVLLNIKGGNFAYISYKGTAS